MINELYGAKSGDFAQQMRDTTNLSNISKMSGYD
jgi:hypothetical protein